MQEKFNKVCILTCSDVYEKLRADFVYNYFKEKSVNVVVHTTDFLHIEKCKREDKKENYIFHETIAYSKNLSYDRIHSHMKLSKDLVDGIMDEEFDLLWVILPPNSLAKNAIRYKKAHPKTKLVFDIMDVWPETMPINGLEWTPPVKYWKYLRDKNLMAADAVVTECSLFKDIIPNELSKERKLYTMFLGRQSEAFQSNPKLSSEKLSLCYLGSINNIIDIDGICELINALSTKAKVELHIIGDGERREEFVNRTKETKAEVIYHGLIYDRQTKQDIFDQCHFGLNVMKSSVVIGLTMKSIDYFEYGLPVINNINGDTRYFVDKENMGVNISNNYQASVEKIIDEAHDTEMRKNARAFFERNLSEAAVTAQLEHILEEL